MRAILLAFLTCTLAPLQGPTTPGCPSGTCASRPAPSAQTEAWCPSGSCDDALATIWCPSGSCDAVPTPPKGQKAAASCPYGSCDVVSPNVRS